MKIPYLGTSMFGCMHKDFPRHSALKAFPRKLSKVGTAVLYDTYGSDWRFIESWLEKFHVTPHCIEFHLTFRKNNPSLPEYARDITRKMEKISKPGTRVLISPILEDGLDDYSWKCVARQVKKKTPYSIVRCPLMRGATGGYYLERHGEYPTFWRSHKKWIANMDGVSTNFNDGTSYFRKISILGTRDFFLRHSNCFMVLSWYAPGSNGLDGCTGWGAKGVKPPRERSFIWTAKAVHRTRRILSHVERLMLYGKHKRRRD